MKRQINSFKCAARGFLYAVRTQGHMRFHIVVGAYVMVFSALYRFTAVQQAILLTLISVVLAAELFNTSLEKICDLEIDGYNILIKVVKDMAAGAVLAVSVLAAAVGIMFFADEEAIKRILSYFMSNPPIAALFIVSLVLSAVFVVFGPDGIWEFFRKVKRKIKSQK